MWVLEEQGCSAQHYCQARPVQGGQVSSLVEQQGLHQHLDASVPLNPRPGMIDGRFRVGALWDAPG
jgi:hypothetical protein